jgi:hypothetical protein
VLVDENEGNVLAGRQGLEVLSDLLLGRLLRVDDEEVRANLLVTVANAGKEKASDGVLQTTINERVSGRVW